MAEANGGEMLFTIVRRSSCEEADPIETAHLLLEDFDGTDIDHEALTYLHQNEGSIDAVQQQGFDLNNEMQQTLLNAAEIEHCTENHLEQLKDSGMLDEIPQDIELKQNLSGEDERHRYSNVKDIGIDMNNSTHIYFRHCIVDKIKCTENNSSCYKRNESYKGTYQQEEVIKDRVLNTEISTEENKTVTFYEEKNSGDDQSNDLYMDMVNEIGQSSPRKEEKWSAASSSICSLCLSHRKYEFESSSSDTEMLSNGKYVRQICICPKNLPNFTHKSLPLHYVSDMHEDRDEYLHKDKILLEKNNAIKDTYVPRADSFTVDILPDEVMFKIFSFFSPTELCRYIAPVCRKWLHYARDPTLWTYISYDEFRDVQSELFAKVLTSWCTLVKDIDFRCRNDLDGRDFKAIFMNCPLLEKVSFAFCSQLDHKILQQLSKYCKHVHSVNMEGTQINDSSLMYLVGLPIKSINVSHCNYLSDEGLTFMAMNFCGLEEVNFDGIQWITQDSIQVLVDNCSDSLTGISFDGADLTDDTTRLLSRCQKTRYVFDDI